MAFDDTYLDFVASQAQATLWHAAGFLECLVIGQPKLSWHYASVHESGELVAILPYCRKNRLDGWVVTMPPLLRYCGPLFSTPWLEKVGCTKAVELILAAVPKGYRSFEQAWPPRCTALSNEGKGEDEQMKILDFKIKSRTTHTLELEGVSRSELQKVPRRKMRQDLRKAESNLSFDFITRLNDEVHQVLESPFEKQELGSPYRRENLEAVMNYLAPSGRIACLGARSEDGRLQSAAIFLRDAETSYAWLTGSTQQAKLYSGGSYVLWEGVLWANSQSLLRVDFLGSDHAGIAANLRHLGGKPTPYPSIYRDAAPWTKALRAYRQRD